MIKSSIEKKKNWLNKNKTLIFLVSGNYRNRSLIKTDLFLYVISLRIEFYSQRVFQ